MFGEGVRVLLSSTVCRLSSNWFVVFQESWTLVPTEELRGILLCIFLEEEPGPCPMAALLFLDCSSFVSAFPPFPDKQLFEFALWNSGKVKEAE